MLKNDSLKSYFARRLLFSNKGQVLIESVAAISVLAISLVAILALLNQSLRLNRVSAESYIATYLAAEGIEIARNIVDANALQKKEWDDGFADNASYEVEYEGNSMIQVACAINECEPLKYNPDTHLYSYSGSVTTPFRRLIKVDLVGSDEIKVNSIVSWTGAGGGSSSVNLEDHFMNWRS